jgi:Ni,Fe-hydrogenase maturation factor
LVARSDLAEMPVATHHLSLGMLMDEIAARTGAITLLLGIQPASLKLGAELSPPVRRSIEEIVSWMDACWSSRGSAT